MATVFDVVKHANDDQITIVLPLGAKCVGLGIRQMHDLSNRLALLHKSVVFVGGDHTLRAAAVAAGFVAATTLDESEALDDPTMLSRVTTADAAPALSLVRDDDVDTDEMLYDPLNDEPPTYVLDLLAQDGVYTGPRDGSVVSAGDDERDTPERLRLSSEQYEDDVTETIRSTGGIPPT
jgi:hypothetical protein